MASAELKKQNTFEWDEDQASEHDKEYSEPFRFFGGIIWGIRNCNKERKPPYSVDIASMVADVVLMSTL